MKLASSPGPSNDAFTLGGQGPFSDTKANLPNQGSECQAPSFWKHRSEWPRRQQQRRPRCGAYIVGGIFPRQPLKIRFLHSRNYGRLIPSRCVKARHGSAQKPPVSAAFLSANQRIHRTARILSRLHGCARRQRTGASADVFFSSPLRHNRAGNQGRETRKWVPPARPLYIRSGRRRRTRAPLAPTIGRIRR